MAQENNRPQQQIELTQERRSCPRDCRLCSWPQQTFCSAQMSFYMMERFEQLQQQMGALQQTINEMKQKQEQPVELINPVENVKK